MLPCTISFFQLHATKTEYERSPNLRKNWIIPTTSFYINHLELKIINPVVVTGSHFTSRGFLLGAKGGGLGGANSNLQNHQPLRTRNLHETSGPWQIRVELKNSQAFLVNTSENLLKQSKNP